MASTSSAPPQPTTMELVGGALNDAEELIGLHLKMFKAEIQDDIRQTLRATTFMGVGLGLLFASVLLLALTAAQALHDGAGLSLSSSLGLVSLVVLAVGAGLTITAVLLFRSFNPLPEESAQALQENVEWIAKHK